MAQQEQQVGPGVRALRQEHLRIMDLYLQGKGNADIARATGYSTAGIRGVINSQLFQHQAALRRAEGQKAGLVASREEAQEINRILKANAELAEQQIVTLMMSAENEGVKLNAAKEILDRAYGKQGEQAHVTVMEKGSIQVLIQTLRECGEPALLEDLSRAIGPAALGEAPEESDLPGIEPPPIDAVVDGQLLGVSSPDPSDDAFLRDFLGSDIPT